MWRTMKSKYAGTCKRCAKDFEEGTVIIWNSRTRYVAHKDCNRPDAMLKRDAIRASMAEEQRAFLAAMRSVQDGHTPPRGIVD